MSNRGRCCRADIDNNAGSSILCHTVMNRSLNRVCKCGAGKICAASSFIRGNSGCILGSNIVCRGKSMGARCGPNSVGCMGAAKRASSGKAPICGSSSVAIVKGTGPSFAKNFGGAFSCGNFSLSMFVMFSCNGSVFGVSARHFINPCRPCRGVLTSTTGHFALLSPHAKGRTASLGHVTRLGPGRRSLGVL